MNAQRGEFAFAPPGAKQGEVIRLTSDESHHLFRVRRVRESDAVWVTDGAGMVYACRVQPDQSLLIQTTHPSFGECRADIRVCCAVLKGDSNRAVVDSAVQLGAGGIIFFNAQRSEGRLTESSLEKLQRTAITALKQCGRALLPDVTTHPDLAGALAALPESTAVFVAHPAESQVGDPDNPSVNITSPVALIVGPEGGFTDRELKIVQQRDGRLLNLAAARLRSETAVTAGLTYVLGWVGESRVFREE